MILQLNPPVPVETEKGRGYALFLIDYSQEHDTLWGVALNDTGEVWWIPNAKIRVQINYSMGRPGIASIPATGVAPIPAQVLRDT